MLDPKIGISGLPSAFFPPASLSSMDEIKVVKLDQKICSENIGSKYMRAFVPLYFI